VTEQTERLAHHALRGEVWEKALAYCRQAGEKALTRSAYRYRALPRLERAMGICQEADLLLFVPSPHRRDIIPIVSLVVVVGSTAYSRFIAGWHSIG
jgi:hypothetical protein